MQNENGVNDEGAVAKLQPAPKEKTEPVHCESGDTGSVLGGGARRRTLLILICAKVIDTKKEIL